MQEVILLEEQLVQSNVDRETERLQAQEKANHDKKHVERENVRLQSTVDMLGLLSLVDRLTDTVAESEMVEKELAIAESQSLMEQLRQDLAAAHREATMASSYKKEIDELSIYLQEYQAKSNNKAWLC